MASLPKSASEKLKLQSYMEVDGRAETDGGDYGSNKSKQKKRRVSDFEGVKPIGDMKAMKLKALRSSKPDFRSRWRLQGLTKEEFLESLTGSGWKDPGNLSWSALRKICLIKLEKELKKPKKERTLHRTMKRIVLRNNAVQRRKQKCCLCKA